MIESAYKTNLVSHKPHGVYIKHVYFLAFAPYCPHPRVREETPVCPPHDPGLSGLQSWPTTKTTHPQDDQETLGKAGVR